MLRQTQGSEYLDTFVKMFQTNRYEYDYRQSFDTIDTKQIPSLLQTHVCLYRENE